MTLNVTLVSRRAIYQSSDFRLSDWDAVRKAFVPRDHLSQKQIVATGNGWTATIAFTGIGITSKGLDVADWVAEHVGAFGRDQSYLELIKLLQSADAWLATIPRRFNPRHTFVVAGYVGAKPVLNVISNFESAAGNTPPRKIAASKLSVTGFKPTLPQLIITGQPRSVQAEDRRLLLNKLRAGVASGEIHDTLAEVNERASKSPWSQNSVSAACFMSSVFPDGTAHALPHGLDESRDYRPRFADLPSQFGFRLRPAVDEHGRPKPIQIRQMAFARSPSTESEHLQRLKMKPEDPELHNNYGAYLLDIKQDVPGAEREFAKALELNPNFSLALSNLGNVLWHHHKNYDRAENCYKRALAADERNGFARRGYAAFLTQERSDYAAAEEQYQAGLAANESDAQLIRDFAQFEFSRRNYKEATELAERLLNLLPDDANAMANLAAGVTLTGGSSQRAMELYRATLAKQPGHPEALVNLAQLLFADGEHEEAGELVKRCLELGPRPEVALEAWLYRFAHVPEQREQGLREVKALVLAGVRSTGWDFSQTVDRAIRDGHPEPELLSTLADVASGQLDETPLNALDEYTLGPRRRPSPNTVFE